MKFFHAFRFNGWVSHFWWLFLDLCLSAVGLGLFLSCVLLVCKISLKIDHTEQQTSVHLENQLLCTYICFHLFPRAALVVTLEDYKRCLILLFGDGNTGETHAALAEATFPLQLPLFFWPIRTHSSQCPPRLHKAIKVEKNQSHMQPKWERDGFRFLHCSLFIHLQTCKWDFGKYMHAEGPFVCFAGWLVGSDSQDNDIRQQQLYSNCSRAIIFNRRIQQTSPLVARLRDTHTAPHGSSSSFLSIW